MIKIQCGVAFAANLNSSGTSSGIEGDSPLGDGWGMGKEDRGRCLVVPDEALHGVVASSEAVTFDQSLMGRRDLYPLVGPCADLVGKGLCQGLRWLRASWELEVGIPGHRWAGVSGWLRSSQPCSKARVRS